MIDTLVGPTETSSELVAPRTAMTVHQRGRALIGHRLLNKDTGFSDAEREALGLRGLLPPRVTSINEQVALELEHVRRKGDDLEQYIGLAALQDRNETLFYRLLCDNLEEFVPIVYTPTVGRACQQFSHIMRRPRGVWLTPDDVGRMDHILRDAAEQDVRLIVVTDNERILGLGDQGAGGMPIPIGKLALYTAAAGLYPAWTLPVSLDVGTDRAELREDPLYLGYRAPRLRGSEYDAFLESFVEAVKTVFPSALLQWEDFKQHNALRILDRYRHRLPCFNDDIQGTGAVVLGGLLAARRAQAGLRGERFMFIGAGAAGIGIARAITRELIAEGATADEARQAMAMFNSRGLVHTGRDDLADDQVPHAIDLGRFLSAGLSAADMDDPVAVARVHKPTILIGTTGCRGAFAEPLIREIASNHEQPIILPLSNPDVNSEARAEDVIEWTGGRAIVATGSPSRDVEFGGRRRTIGQANNVFIFPGMGLGAVVAQARELSDEAFLVAARTLAGLVTDGALANGTIYPPVSTLRPVARAIAEALVIHFRDSGYGRQLRDEQVAEAVDRAMWRPEYLDYAAD
jgi:malate dehydrogenase (oxaloacetate-decarboxylating)